MGFLSLFVFALVVSVRFEDDLYRVVEGEVVEVCVLAEGGLDSPFSLLIETTDITALGLPMKELNT